MNRNEKFRHQAHELRSWKDGATAIAMMAWLFAASLLTGASGCTGWWCFLLWVTLVGVPIGMLGLYDRNRRNPGAQ